MAAKFKQFSGFGLYPRRSLSYDYIPLGDEHPFQFNRSKDSGKIILRGNGRSYGDASLGNEQDTLFINTPRNMLLELNRDVHTLNAMSGITFESILEAIVPHGYILPVLPGTRHVTLGGALSANVHGKNHHRCGGVYSFADSLDVLTQTYEGLCSPLNEKELFDAMLGGFGLAGWIRSATLRLKQISSLSIAAEYHKAFDLEELMRLSTEYSDQHEYAVAWIDTLSGGSKLGRGVLMLGDHADGSVAAHPLPVDPGEFRWRRSKNIPFKHALSFFMNPLSIGVFNEMYYQKYPRGCSRDMVHIEDWFFPLDSVVDWNHLYGDKGFLQYQFCIPEQNASSVIKSILEHCQKFQMGSFLSVLKKMRQDENMLPFAMHGWTLAMDIPILHSEVFPVLDQLDDMVVKAGGRIYLAKDARMSDNTFKTMYPEWERFIKTVSRYNPGRPFGSELSRRLKI